MDEFKWAQWDGHHQRLYVVYPKVKVIHQLLLYTLECFIEISTTKKKPYLHT